jgi:hypothetical protein
VKNTTRDKIVRKRGPGKRALGEESGGESSDSEAPKTQAAPAPNNLKAVEAGVGINMATAPLHMQAQYYGMYNQGSHFIPQPPPYPNHQMYPPFNPHGQPQPPHPAPAAVHLGREVDNTQYPPVRDWLASIDAHPSRALKGHLYFQYADAFELNMFNPINRIPMNRERWTAKELSEMLDIPPGILDSILSYLETDLPSIRAGALVIRPADLRFDFQDDFNNALNDPQPDYTY